MPYDVIVVGAGSAGAVLGARLSENPGTSVLVLEAGPDHMAGDTPPAVKSAFWYDALFEPGRLWGDLVASRGKGRGATPYPRGRGVGGSSSINTLGVIRGTVDDYERWAHELGCPGWGWPDMLKGFLRAEDDVEYGGDGLHGAGGPIPLWRTPMDRLPPLDHALREALAELGYAFVDDYHAPAATGVSRWAATLRDGQRVSTNDAYLEPARSRPNFEVCGNVVVDRLLLDGRRVTGVRATTGEEFEAREVIVSAGAIHSPAILLRSGIGVDDGLPVGANLKDHARFPEFEITLKPGARLPAPNVSVISSVLRYTSGIAGTGPNDMQITWLAAKGASAEMLAIGKITGSVMRVFSRGEVRLRSRDPEVAPIVEFNFLADERDLVRLRDCMRRTITILRHGAVASISERVSLLGVPIEELSEDDDAIDRWLTQHVTDYVHAAGTCRMGPPGNPAAVVDTDCRVIGYEQVRVCDASVMPDLPKANTHLSTVAVAERLAMKMAEDPSLSSN